MICSTFLKTLKHDVSVFDAFNIGTLEHCQDRINYEHLLTAKDRETLTFEPKRVIVESKSRIDHIISKNQLQTETVPTANNDPYTKKNRFPLIVYKHQTTESSLLPEKRKLEPPKTERVLKILFSLNQQLEALNKNVSAKLMVDNITRTVIKTVDHFALARP